MAFYRIAATAAWSAGALRNTQVLPLRDKGARPVPAGATLTSEQLNAAQSLTLALSQTLQKILQQRAAAGVPVESFDAFLTLTLTRGFCTLPGLVGRIANGMPPQALMEQVRNDARQAQDALRNAAISTTCN